MNYIGVDSVETAKERGAIRVSEGGHGIPDDVIERRYGESLVNLNNAINLCNEIKIYYNTDMFKLAMFFNNGEMIWKDSKVHKWLKNNINS